MMVAEANEARPIAISPLARNLALAWVRGVMELDHMMVAVRLVALRQAAWSNAATARMPRPSHVLRKRHASLSSCHHALKGQFQSERRLI